MPRHQPPSAAAEHETVTADLPTDGDFQMDLEVPISFSVRDEASANWVVRKITEARRYAQKAKEFADFEARRAAREEEFFLRRFGDELSAWAAAQIAAVKGKKKSINLPAGCVGFRRCDTKLVVDDEDAVLAWAQQACPEAVSTVLKLSKTAINEHFGCTGEIPGQGAHVEPAGDRFYVR